jgi:hypothetical protein
MVLQHTWGSLGARACTVGWRTSGRLVSIDPVAAADGARRIFTDAADAVRTRWLNLELGGYRASTDVRPLHLVLQVAANDRLAVHVTAYRTQRGLTTGSSGAVVEFRHFFVEPLSDLLKAREVVQASGTSTHIDLG